MIWIETRLLNNNRSITIYFEKIYCRDMRLISEFNKKKLSKILEKKKKVYSAAGGWNIRCASSPSSM